MANRGTLLALAHLTKQYPGQNGGGPVHVLRETNLEIGEGESIAIIGPSGSGKSTLLNIIGTLDHPTAGEVRLDGRNIAGANDAELAALRNRQIGFIFQAHHLLPQCTVVENVLLPTLAARVERKEPAEARARRLLKRVGLEARLSHRPGHLSGGERQRVAVVRALINEPRLLLADEPTGALDRASADNLGQLLVDLNREEGVTLIVVTHSLELAKRMGRVYELRDGTLRAQ